VAKWIKFHILRKRGDSEVDRVLRDDRTPWRGETFGVSPMESGAKRAPKIKGPFSTYQEGVTAERALKRSGNASGAQSRGNLGSPY
jgi:hypothetical protein